LLAEDHAINQKVVVSLLERSGHQVEVVANGLHAVEAVISSDFDLVLMDVQMPVMDGFEAVAAIRRAEQASGRHIPMIALTAHAMKGDRERCLSGGFDGYLSKPVRVDSFLAAIESISSRGSRLSEPTADNTTPPAFDLDAALETFGGDEGLFREILGLFLVECPRLVGEIREAIETEDASKLCRTTHSLKGTASHFAASELMAIAGRLEAIGRSGSCVGAAEQSQDLVAAVQRFTDAARNLDLEQAPLAQLS
jgi:CheY-like chemotaxis protein